jgi:hypothetical protein
MVVREFYRLAIDSGLWETVRMAYVRKSPAKVLPRIDLYPEPPVASLLVVGIHRPANVVGKRRLVPFPSLSRPSLLPDCRVESGATSIGMGVKRHVLEPLGRLLRSYF